ncbi:hypothetical protein [Streptomyces sp. SID12501]|uniref:hypothetical protein n=1 Tax=Streptomyces sp. SID12501 TaxID=2706042 RepID=UPI001EF21458|nr:hypothetical protein [Streptomyces sp. SID12501]
MSPKRGERAAPPPVDNEYDVRFANTEAATGWEHLSRHSAGNLRRAFERICANPRALDHPDRHHQLKGKLGTSTFKGHTLERWQYEVTEGGRIWYLLDDANRTAWITYAGTGHPKVTDGAALSFSARAAWSRHWALCTTQVVVTRCDCRSDQNCCPVAYNPPDSSQVLSALPVPAGDVTALPSATGSGNPDTAGALRGPPLRPRPDGCDQTIAGSRKAPAHRRRHMSIRTTGRLVLATATSVALAGGLLSLSAGPVTAATQAKYADDYNGDGYRDYAFGHGGDSVTVNAAASGPVMGRRGAPGTLPGGAGVCGGVRSGAVVA